MGKIPPEGLSLYELTEDLPEPHRTLIRTWSRMTTRKYLRLCAQTMRMAWDPDVVAWLGANEDAGKMFNRHFK